MGGAGGLRNLSFAISTMRFQDNDLSDACEYIDDFVDSRNRFTTPDYVKPVRAH